MSGWRAWAKPTSMMLFPFPTYSKSWGKGIKGVGEKKRWGLICYDINNIKGGLTEHRHVKIQTHFHVDYCPINSKHKAPSSLSSLSQMTTCWWSSFHLSTLRSSIPQRKWLTDRLTHPILTPFQRWVWKGDFHHFPKLVQTSSVLC